MNEEAGTGIQVHHLRKRVHPENGPVHQIGLFMNRLLITLGGVVYEITGIMLFLKRKCDIAVYVILDYLYVSR